MQLSQVLGVRIQYCERGRRSTISVTSFLFTVQYDDRLGRKLENMDTNRKPTDCWTIYVDTNGLGGLSNPLT